MNQTTEGKTMSDGRKKAGVLRKPNYSASEFMNRKRSIVLAAGILLAIQLASASLEAQSVSATPAGFYKLTLLGNSDTIVSPPFTRPEAAAGQVQSVSGNVIEVNGMTGWAINQFAYASGSQSNTYFLLIRSGTKEGNSYTITSNGPNTLTLDLNGDTLTGLNVNDRLAVIPYWTLGSVFPGGKGVHVTTSIGNRLTEVLMPDLSGTGINLSASKTYYFFSGNWRQVGAVPTLAIKNDDVLLPDAYFIVRHNTNINTTLTTLGGVVASKWVLPLSTQLSAKQDNFVAIPRPVKVSLDASGLIESGAFSASPSFGSHTDELLTFDNTTINKNRSASGTYFYFGGAWRLQGAGGANVGSSNVFSPGTGVIIRKNAAVGTPLWVNSPTY